MRRKRALICLLLFALLAALLPARAVCAGYDAGYFGGGGDGSGIYAHGVDVSSWQGSSVDFEKLKAQGIDFVILRAGFATTEDGQFETNYARAKAAGLDVGVYLYSYAATPQDAAAEAEALKSWLDGKLLEYPVYYDVEDPEIHVPMSAEKLTELILTFLDSMARDGWLTGLYSSISWLDDKLETEKLCERYECWMALYYDNTYQIYDRYDERFGMWQYSASGAVDGIPGNADLDICFKDYPAICRRFGFNGYPASGETLLLSGASAPPVLVTGDRFDVTGRVTSTEGELLHVSAGIYREDGTFLTGSSAAPRSRSFDLSELAQLVQMQTLGEGRYEYRVTAQNAVGTQTLLKQSVVVSSCGVRLDDAAFPEDGKAGEVFLPSGRLSATTALREVRLSVFSEDGAVCLQASAAPEAREFDLSTLSLPTQTLSAGVYSYCLSVQTEIGRKTVFAEPFVRYVRDDPVTLSGFSLRTEYLLGELTDLPGVISSEKSPLQTVRVVLSSRSGERVAATARQKKQILLSEFRQSLRLDELPAGTYTIRIEALNAGGPVTLAEQTFLLRADDLSLCGFVAPEALSLGDTFLLDGVVASDASPLSFVGVTVTDGEGKLVLDAAAIPQGVCFDLRELNPRVLFSTLPAGDYALRITAQNGQTRRTLYDGRFFVTASSDKIVWEAAPPDLYGISYYSGSPVALWGVLRSEESDLESVSVQLLDEAGSLMESAYMTVSGKTATLQPFHETLRLSALPAGDYRLEILAENATAEYRMFSQSFSVTDCPHANVTTGEVYSASCDRRGAVCDSRCLQCGAKIRCGTVLPPEAHEYQDGRCAACGRAEPVTVSVRQSDQMPGPNGRCVIAVETGGQWYALGADAQAVPLRAPDALGRTAARAELLWKAEPEDREAGTIRLTNAYGQYLHLDSAALTIGRGTANTGLAIAAAEDGLALSLPSEPLRALHFDGADFTVGSDASRLIVFSYPADETPE